METKDTRGDDRRVPARQGGSQDTAVPFSLEKGRPLHVETGRPCPLTRNDLLAREECSP